MLKTAIIVGQGHLSLNLLASFFHPPTFCTRSLITPCCSSCFHFLYCPLILPYIPGQLFRNETPLLQKKTSHLNRLLLGNLRDHSRVSNFALFTMQNLKKNTLFIDQSAFSNFALQVISIGKSMVYSDIWLKYHE